MGSNDASVLFVCTGNAGRSQIAEELFRKLAPADTTICSAGVEPWKHVHPVAAQLLVERGIDIRHKKPRHVRDLAGHEPFGLIVTIGSPARDGTPEFPGHPVRVHWDVDDPADADGTPDSEATFRRTLEAIENRLGHLLEVMQRTIPRLPPFSGGISTCVVRPAPFQPAKHLPLIARAGFSSIELNCNQGEEDFQWRSPQALSELARVADSEGVRICSVHAFGNYPGARFDEGLCREYLDTNRAFCQLAAELGAPVLVIHPLKPRRDVPAGWAERMHQMLDDLAQEALPLPLILGVENVNWLVVPSEDLALIRSQSPAATGFVLDTGHADLFGACDEYLALSGLRLCGLHLQDTDGERDRHWLPGEGRFDWQGFMKRLLKTGYTGPLMLEVQAFDRQDDLPGYLDDCASAVRMLQACLSA